MASFQLENDAEEADPGEKSFLEMQYELEIQRALQTGLQPAQPNDQQQSKQWAAS